MLAGRQLDNCLWSQEETLKAGSKQSKMVGSPTHCQHSKSDQVNVLYVRIEGLQNIEGPFYFSGLGSVIAGILADKR